MSDGAHRHNARDGADVLVEILAEARQARRTHVDLFLGNRHPHGQHVLRIQSGIDAQQPRHALDHQPGAAKAPPAPAPLRTPPARDAGGCRRLYLALRPPSLRGSFTLVRKRAQGRRDAEQHARQAGNQQGKREHAAIHRNRIDGAQRQVQGIQLESIKQQPACSRRPAAVPPRRPPAPAGRFR